MSKLNTLLNVGIIGMQASHQSKLNQMQRQHEDAALAHAVIQMLREEIFKFKQSADEILVMEAYNPKTAAASMGILDSRLQDFGISSDLFPDISDKEYAAEAIKSIQFNNRRLRDQLSVEDRQEVEAVVEAAAELPSYEYYLGNYQEVHEYREAKPVYDALRSKNNSCLQVIVVLGALATVPLLLASICGLTGSIFGETGASILGCLGGLLGFAGVIGGYLWYTNNMAQGNEYRQAQKRVDEFEKGDTDLELFEQFERRYGSNYADVAAERDQAELLVNNFFDELDYTK